MSARENHKIILNEQAGGGARTPEEEARMNAAETGPAKAPAFVHSIKKPEAPEPPAVTAAHTALTSATAGVGSSTPEAMSFQQKARDAFDRFMGKVGNTGGALIESAGMALGRLEIPDSIKEKIKATPGAIKEGLSSLFEKAGETVLGSRIKILYNDMWAQWHEGNKAGYQKQLDGIQVKIDEIDRQIQMNQSMSEALKKQGVDSSGDTANAIARLQTERMGLKDKADPIHSRLLEYHDSAQVHVNRRNRAAENIIGKYDEQLAPHRETLAKLGEQKEELDTTVETATGNIAGLEANIVDIESRMDGALSKELLDAARERVASLKERIKESRGYIQEANNKKSKVENAIRHAQRRARPLEDVVAKYKRKTQAGPAPVRAGERMEERQGDEEDVSAGGRVAYSASGPRSPEAQSSVELQAVGVDDYIVEWNKMFSSDIKLDKNIFEARGINTKEEVPFEVVETAIKGHLQSRKEKIKNLDKKLAYIRETISSKDFS